MTLLGDVARWFADPAHYQGNDAVQTRIFEHLEVSGLAVLAGLLDKALTLFHFCLSQRVAGALAGAEKVRIAERPDEVALLDLVGAGQ